MMSCTRLDHVLAPRATDTARWTEHDWRAFVVRLVVKHDRATFGLELFPSAFERLRLLRRIVAVDELTLPGDPRGDELIGKFTKYRPSLRIVGCEQGVAAPAF